MVDNSTLNNKAGLSHVIKNIAKEGKLAFYSGYLTNLVRITPHYAITFVLYEHLS